MLVINFDSAESMVGISVGKGEVNCVGMGEGSKELSTGLDTGERVALSKGSLVLFTGVTTSEEVILQGPSAMGSRRGLGYHNNRLYSAPT